MKITVIVRDDDHALAVDDRQECFDATDGDHYYYLAIISISIVH